MQQDRRRNDVEIKLKLPIAGTLDAVAVGNLNHDHFNIYWRVRIEKSSKGPKFQGLIMFSKFFFFFPGSCFSKSCFGINICLLVAYKHVNQVTTNRSCAQSQLIGRYKTSFLVASWCVLIWYKL